ncbi:hypothetical protein NPIL_642241 [Nephila pilipes]|uniref:Uncharacterized protein n=1 Tax=Nephila pilipes TaxID=299642 RepID=A0A8X6U7P4_NEPPI|nr:hypothetical protein NPIL_642241 [Nephila pilipes]
MTRSHQAHYLRPSKDPGPRLSAGHDPFPSQNLSHPALGPPWRRTLTIFAVAQKSMCHSVEDNKRIRRLVKVDRSGKRLPDFHAWNSSLEKFCSFYLHLEGWWASQKRFDYC